MRFRTLICHKPGTVLDVAGQQFALEPDARGYAEFEAGDETVIARLVAIPEGFAVVEPLVGEQQPPVDEDAQAREAAEQQAREAAEQQAREAAEQQAREAAEQQAREAAEQAQPDTLPPVDAPADPSAQPAKRRSAR